MDGTHNSGRSTPKNTHKVDVQCGRKVESLLILPHCFLTLPPQLGRKQCERKTLAATNWTSASVSPSRSHVDPGVEHCSHNKLLTNTKQSRIKSSRFHFWDLIWFGNYFLFPLPALWMQIIFINILDDTSPPIKQG